MKDNNIEVIRLDLKLKKGHAVCFDFDGVIHKYSKGWQDGSIYDEYNKNVLDLMLFLQKAGIPVFICSTREPFQIINWWNKQRFWCDTCRVNDNETFWKELNLIGVTNRKLPAQLYIDDKGYKYTGQTVKQFVLDNSDLEKEEAYYKGYVKREQEAIEICKTCKYKEESRKKDKIIDEIQEEIRDHIGFENRLKKEKREPDLFNQGRFYVAII